MSFLEDGTGAGYRQKVTSENRASVDALRRTSIHAASFERSVAYMANTATTAITLTQTGTIGTMLLIQNDSPDQVLVISRVDVSTGADDTFVQFVKNYTIGTIADHNVFVPVNLDFRSSRVAEATVYNWAETNNGLGGLSGGTVLGSYIQSSAPFAYSFDDGLILGRNDNFAVDMDVAGEIAVAAFFYYRPIS